MLQKDNARFDEEFDNSSNTESTNAFSTPEDYQAAIKVAISKLPATEKSKKQTEIVNAGLPKAYQKLTDMNDLKKYYEIVSAQ